MSDAAAIVAELEAEESDRSAAESVWSRIAEYVRPIRNDLLTEFNYRPDPNVYDGTAIEANDRLQGTLYARITNPANKWFSIRVLDSELMRIDAVKLWCEEAGRRVLASFGPSVSQFYTSVPEAFGDCSAFGNACMYQEQAPGRQRFRDVLVAMSEFHFQIDASDAMSTAWRKFMLWPHQLKERFPAGGFSREVAKLIDATDIASRRTRVEIVHHVRPNPRFDGSVRIGHSQAFESVYIERKTRHQTSTGFYREMPYHLMRWRVPAGEKLGIGQARGALANILMVNQGQRTHIELAQRIADPVKLAADEDTIGALRTSPGQTAYGAIDAAGRALVQYLEPGGNLPLTLEILNQVREQISRAFFGFLGNLQGRTGLAPDEVLLIDEQEQEVMSPYFGRIQTEFLAPYINRRVSILERLGQLPPRPPEIDGVGVEPLFTSPMAQAQRASEARAAIRLASAAKLVAEVDPEAIDGFDGDAALRVIQEGSGAGSELIRRAEAIAARRQARAEQQGRAENIGAGQGLADIMAKLGQAAPQQQPAA